MSCQTNQSWFPGDMLCELFQRRGKGQNSWAPRQEKMIMENVQNLKYNH